MPNKEADIADRIKTLREIAEMTPEEVANGIKCSVSDYLKYESGTEVVPMGSLMELARFHGVEMTDLLEGGLPMLHTFSFVKNGHGMFVERGEEHKHIYQHLAYNFANRKVEPFLVTVEYNENEEMHINSHEGQEFNYCTEGKLLIYLDGQEIIMEPGDSLYFDSLKPHGMKALDGKTAKFIAIIF